METWHQSVLLVMRTCKIICFGDHMAPVIELLCIHNKLFDTVVDCLEKLFQDSGTVFMLSFNLQA